MLNRLLYCPFNRGLLALVPLKTRQSPATSSWYVEKVQSVKEESEGRSVCHRLERPGMSAANVTIVYSADLW